MKYPTTPETKAPSSRARRAGGRSGAFTLIELLVVIGIIVILAGLTVAVIPAVNEKRARSVASTHLKALVMAIEAYRADLNAYPPDNPTNAARPPLFYELSGAQPDNEDNPTRYVCQATGQSLPLADLQAAFGRSGLLNSGSGEQKARNYYPNLKPNQYAPDPAFPSGPVFLVEPLKGPEGDFNPWHYNSSNPTNNPNSFDLWVFIQPRDKVLRIAN